MRAWKKHYALPSEHGAWIWWIGPMGVGVAASVILLATGWVPWLVPVAFAAMLLDTAEGVLRPALAVRPATIGFRQLVMSVLFVSIVMTGYLL